MSEMTVEMVIAALKAGHTSYQWDDVLEWTDWATGDELRSLAKGLTEYIVQRAPHWRSCAGEFWVDLDGLSIPLIPGWRSVCSDQFVPSEGRAVPPAEVLFVVDRLLEFGLIEFER